MTKTRVLILGKLPPPYMGPSIATEILLKSDLKNRFDLIHVDTKINHSISSFGRWNFSKISKNVSIYLNLVSVLRKRKPQIVLIPISQTTTGFIKDSVFILLAGLFKTQIIIQLRGSDIQNWLNKSSSLTKSYFKFILKKTKGVIVLGNNLKYLFKDYYPNETIFVIPNGGNYSIPEKPVTTNTVKILYFSNLLESKGIEDVVQAVSILKKQKLSQPFSVDLVGAWYSKVTENNCLQLIKNDQLPVTIHSPKSGNDKLNFLANADIFVFPPREPEGHPWAIVEAMAAKLPIISTDKGAIIESVINNENGFIVPEKNPEMIAQKLRLLVENSELRKQMGLKSYNLYLTNFTEEKMVDKYTSTFNAILK